MNRVPFGGCSEICLPAVLRRRPQAAAILKGSEDFPALSGVVRFYRTGKGVIVWAQVRELPKSEAPCHAQIFGFHIHSGPDCSGNGKDPFTGSMSHYNPQGCDHSYHAGDLPPLFGNDGLAFSLFLTNRFSVDEVIGRTVILHDRPDDFATQPSGNSGKKIACGVIRKES